MEVASDLKAAFGKLCDAQQRYLDAKFASSPEHEIIEAMTKRERARTIFDQQLDKLRSH